MLIEERKAAGLTQRALAAKIRMSQSAVAAIEASQRRVDVVEFLDICRALGCDPIELLQRVIRSSVTNR